MLADQSRGVGGECLGDHVIAVEVHNASTNSSDVDFGMTLTATSNSSATVVTPDIVDVTPDPRPTGLDTIVVNFSEPVSGVDWTDFSLSRNGGANLLTSANTLTSSNGGATWTLTNLKNLTWVAGNYTLNCWRAIRASPAPPATM
jgi:hypothetical protein